MTSWIVAIDKTYPQHWTIAAEHGFWDMTKDIKIEAGDSVYFWLSGGEPGQPHRRHRRRPSTRGPETSRRGRTPAPASIATASLSGWSPKSQLTSPSLGHP